MDKNKDERGVLSKIADCARMWFSSVRNRRSARTVSRPRSKRNAATATGAIEVAT